MISGEGPQAALPVNSFTCTLSQAIEINVRKGAKLVSTPQGTLVSHDEYTTIAGFVDFLASRYGSRLAVGCVTPPKKNRTERAGIRHELLSLQNTTAADLGHLLILLRVGFEEVRTLSCRVGSCLRDQSGYSKDEAGWVALVAHSSLVFLVVWLGLIRSGLKVLLIAPQNSPDSVCHLLDSCNARVIFHDSEHKDLVESVLEHNQAPGARSGKLSELSTQAIQLDWASLDELKSLHNSEKETSSYCHPHGEATDVTHSFHSSGTTGRPKLIPQTNHGSVGILPLLHGSKLCNSVISTFTTTPLYHGGIADLLRSWSAGAPLWIFPEAHIPITGANALACIERIDDYCLESESTRTRLGFFSCVPFVLEAMIESSPMLQRLQSMDIVGVGGAAMAKQLGDRLVSEGVPLVSRFGSSECGFLLSSFRDFELDRRWDLLRTAAPELDFRAMETAGNHELIVMEAWPLVSTAEHASRPYNTHDMFMAVDTGVWEYVGRSDTLITLKTGEKFDPVHVEDLLRESDLIREAIVLGEGCDVPIGLIFPSDEHIDAQDEMIWRSIQKVNRGIARYSNLDRQNIIILTFDDFTRIRWNNKGGVIRSSVPMDFEEELARILDTGTASAIPVDYTYDDLVSATKNIIQQHSQCELGLDDDFFDAGLTSGDCVNVCRQISNDLGISGLHLGTLYECGSINELAKYLAGDSTQAIEDDLHIKQKFEEMIAMVDRFVEIQPARLACAKSVVGDQSTSNSEQGAGKVVAITGATGFLGVHLLNQLLQDPGVDAIFTLVRGSHFAKKEDQVLTAKARVDAALAYHRLDADTSKVIFVPYMINESCLGIDKTTYQTMICRVSHVLHAAWQVDFNLPLKNFSSHVQGTVELFNLARLSSEVRGQSTVLTFCSSNASVANGTVKSTQISTDPSDAAQMGYAQSKWVAEAAISQLCQKYTQVKTSILRVGQLSGSSHSGIWNRREAWPLMFDASMTTIKASGGSTFVFPDLASTIAPGIDWLPVDHAAFQVLAYLKGNEVGRLIVRPVYNQVDDVSWALAFQWIRQWVVKQGQTLEVTPAQSWLDFLDSCEKPHRARTLIPLWRKNWQQKTSNGKKEVDEIIGCGITDCGSVRIEDIVCEDNKSLITESYFGMILRWIVDDTI